MSEQVQVFICYAEEDKKTAERLYNDLEKAGVKPWMKEKNILPGQDWKIAIREAIKRSSYFLDLLSSNSVSKDGYFQKERKMALDISDEMPVGKIFILPVHLDMFVSFYRLDERLQKLKEVNLFPIYEDGLERILRVILGTKPDTIPPKITNSLEMKFIYIQPGIFMMGSPKDEKGRDSNEIHHQVTLTKGFYMQTTQVTQKQWKALKGNNPSNFNGCEESPVEQVSWDDVQDFIKKLNSKEGSDKYRLPTEAEWEYACRAGSNTIYCFGNDKNRLKEYAWYDKNSDNQTHPVGQLNPNDWGLYDMHGNVWEWCSDWFGDYPASPVSEPAGPISGKRRVLRGGSWYENEWYCRSASRKEDFPESRYSNYGFRLVRIP